MSSMGKVDIAVQQSRYRKLKDTPVMFRVNKELFGLFKKMAEEEGRNLTEYFEDLVLKKAEEKKLL